MLLNLAGPLVSSHATLYPSMTHIGGSLSPPRLAFQTNVGLTTAVSLTHVTQYQSSSTAVNSSSSIHSRRRRARPNSASSGPLFLHPSGSFPEGVAPPLFTLQPPPSGTSTEFSSQSGGSSSGVGADGTLTAVAAPPTAVEEVTEALDVRLVEETDLPDISALLAEVRERNLPAAYCNVVVFMLPSNNSRRCAGYRRGCPHVTWRHM